MLNTIDLHDQILCTASSVLVSNVVDFSGFDAWTREAVGKQLKFTL